MLNKFIEIKKEYKRRMGFITYDYRKGTTEKSETCLERWVSELNHIELSHQYKEYETLLSYLELNQHENMLLIRYGKYYDIYDEVGENFWKRYDGFYRECRSIVLDVENDCIILCPFSKFFNVNELEETRLENIQKRVSNAKTIEFSDKLDGSMQSARWYNNKIIMAGSQAINPEDSWRLQDGYRMINELLGYKEMMMKYPECTFIFEYISMRDAHVVKYTKEQEGLYLIGIRRVDNGEEYTYRAVLEFAKAFHIPTTKLFDKTMEQIMLELDDKSSDEAEGFVINIDGYKVKLKYNDYVHIHKLLSKLSSGNLVIRSIADEKYDDLLAKLPIAYHEQVKKFAMVVVDYIKKTEKLVREYFNQAPKSNKKEFMLYISKNVPREYQGYCRELYFGKKINVIKSGSDKCPHYKKWKDMVTEDNKTICIEE